MPHPLIDIIARNAPTKKQTEKAQNLRETDSPQEQKSTYLRPMMNTSASGRSITNAKQTGHVNASMKAAESVRNPHMSRQVMSGPSRTRQATEQPETAYRETSDGTGTSNG